MNRDEQPALEDPLVASLTAYQECCANGSEVGAADAEASADPTFAERLSRAQACVRLLDRRWSGPSRAANTGEPLSAISVALSGNSSLGSPFLGNVSLGSSAPVRIGRFQILRELGHGAFGIVFLAIDPALGREVALKVPRPEALVASHLRRRFLREAQAAAALKHPNLVSVFESGEWGPIWYIVEEYCAGESLSAWLKDRVDPVPFPVAAKLIATLAAAVEYAHNQGIIHRDLKPSNVLLDSKCGADSATPSSEHDRLDFVPKLADFGLAKLLEENSDETRSSAILGTPAYMSPEQAEGRLDGVGRQTDVYGLGVILYEMLAGRPPFSGATDIETLRRVVTEEPVPPRQLRPDIPRDLEAICLKCLEKQPSRRYAVAAALVDDLARFLAARPTLARPLGPCRRTVKLVRRRPAVTALLAIIVLASLAGWVGESWHLAGLRNAREINTQLRIEAQNEHRAALQQFVLAEDQTRRVRQYHYATDMASAMAAWRSSHVAEALELLSRHSPRPGEEDFRSFVWYYLWRLCHAELRTFRGNDSEMEFVAFSPDGEKLTTASKDGTARLWDAETGRQLATFRGHKGNVNLAKFSPGGRSLATAGDDNSVKLWNVSPPELRATFTGRFRHVSCLAFSPDGKILASGGKDQIVTLWDTATARERAQFEGHNGGIQNLAFSPDGNLLTSGTDDGTLQVWNLRTGQARIKMKGHQTSKIIGCLSFSHDGTSLASASGGVDRRVKIWDMATGNRKSVFMGHSSTVQSVAFAPDDRTLVVAVKDGSIWRWDVATGRLLNMVHGLTGGVRHAEFSPDGRTLATASADGTVKLWDANAGQTHKTIFGLAFPPAALAISADSNLVAAAVPGPPGAGITFRAWGVRTGAERGSYLHLDGCREGAMSSNGRAIVSRAIVHRDGLGIRLIFSHDHRWIDTQFMLNPLPADRPVAMTSLAVSPDNLLVATGHSHGKVEIWARGTGRKRATMSPDGNNDVCILQFSPDSKLVASATHDGTVRLWDVESGAARATLSGHLGSPLTIAFSPDGTCIATASTCPTVKVWSTENGHALARLQGHVSEVRAVVFSPDGKTLTSGSEDGVLKLWDVATYQELISLDAHRGGVQIVAFSPDGNVLASSGSSAGGRGEVFLWSAAPRED